MTKKKMNKEELRRWRRRRILRIRAKRINALMDPTHDKGTATVEGDGVTLRGFVGSTTLCSIIQREGMPYLLETGCMRWCR